jgi:hypothetical protein
MNNTLCLGIFLVLVYFRGILWEFSAEVVSTLFVTITIGLIAAWRVCFHCIHFLLIVVKTTFAVWEGIVAMILYPTSIALVVFLESPIVGWA